jgi:hypothetical protein
MILMMITMGQQRSQETGRGLSAFGIAVHEGGYVKVSDRGVG